jgi:hypothetical protein
VAARNQRLTFEPPRGCQLCHHNAPATSDCAKCHDQAARLEPQAVPVRVAVAVNETAPRDRTVPFQHAVHAQQRCVTCHTTPVTLAADPIVACRACHEGHHAEGRTCATCHAPADPRPAHATVVDAHVACDNCHAADIVGQLVPNRAFCQTCHAEQRPHYADRQCTTCHFLSSPEAFRAHLRKEAEDGA